MAAIVRATLAFGAGVAAGYFTLWVVLPVLLPSATPVWLTFLLSLGAGLVAGRRAWTGLGATPEGLATAVATGGLTLGGLGLVGGFFGPMIFAPGANQGPLLGLFITGPLGFVVGAVGGAAVWWRRRVTRR